MLICVYDIGRKRKVTMNIGTKIKNARTSANLTQEQVAEALDVSRQTVSNWENEKTYPDIVRVDAATHCKLHHNNKKCSSLR